MIFFKNATILLYKLAGLLDPANKEGLQVPKSWKIYAIQFVSG
jgi:hypothetical protein